MKLTVRRTLALLALCALLLPAGPAQAQSVTTGSIAGIVADAQKAAIPGAAITAVHEPSGTRYENTTHADGRYTIPGVRVGGPYTVTATLSGFQPVAAKDVVVNLGVASDVNLTLTQLAAVTEEITVTAVSDSVFSSSRTGAATTVSEAAISTMPTINDRINDFARLSPQYSGGPFQGSFAITSPDVEGFFLRYKHPAADAAGESRALTVGARKLLDILRALPEGSEVTMTLADKRLQIRSGKSRFQLQTLPAEDFPRLAPPEGGITAFQLPQRALKAVLALVQYAMAQQDIRYYLNGLLMVVDAGELRVVATDGHRLAVATREIAPKELGKQEVIVPRKTVLELAKLLQDTDEPVSIELSGNQARFRFDGVLLASKLVDGKFPDYQRVIPSAHPKQIKAARQTLGAALQRAAILTSDKFRGPG